MAEPEVFSDEELVKTKDILEKTNISRQMFYTYLNLGLIQPIKTLENGHRLFHPNVFRKLSCIQIIRDKNYGLRDMKETWKALTDIVPLNDSEKQD